MSRSFKGVFVALVTPMTDSEEIDCTCLRRLVEFLIEQGGVQGLVPLGSTGEFYALSREEREAVVKTTVEAAAGRVPVVVGTNAPSTREVVELSRQAEDLGADGIMLAAPYYSLPSQEELFEHIRSVDRAVRLPIMLYNYPGRTGVDMTPEFIERLAELKNVRYVKESTGDATRVSDIVRRSGEKIQVFCGCDTLAFESLVLGAVGWVTGVANFLPKELVRLFQLSVQEPSLAEARQLFYRLFPLFSLAESGKYTQCAKAGCELKGWAVGPPRKPLLPLNAQERQRLKKTIELVVGSVR